MFIRLKQGWWARNLRMWCWEHFFGEILRWCLHINGQHEDVEQQWLHWVIDIVWRPPPHHHGGGTMRPPLRDDGWQRYKYTARACGVYRMKALIDDSLTTWPQKMQNIFSVNGLHGCWAYEGIKHKTPCFQTKHTQLAEKETRQKTQKTRFLLLQSSRIVKAGQVDFSCFPFVFLSLVVNWKKRDKCVR